MPFVQGAMFVSITAGVDLARDIESGFLNRLAMTPVRGEALLLGQLGGALLVGTSAGDTASASGDVLVDAGGVLSGHGTIVGDVSVVSGGILSPGSGIGTLTVDGDLALAEGSVLDFEFGAPANAWPDRASAGGAILRVRAATYAETLDDYLAFGRRTGEPLTDHGLGAREDMVIG